MLTRYTATKADVLKELLTKDFAHIPLRWGLTGTIPSKTRTNILRACLGEVVNKLAASELQELGVLSNCLRECSTDGRECRVFKLSTSELTYLTSDRERMKYVSGLIENIRKSGNTLVLVDRIKAGNLILENIPDAEFVSGVMKTTDRKDAYTEINEGTNSCGCGNIRSGGCRINIPPYLILSSLSLAKVLSVLFNQ